MSGGPAVATLLALALDAADARAALAQSWPPFVLVAGLLLIGLIASSDGLFAAAASRVVLLPGGPFALLFACFGLVAAVTAVLNLDTAVVFLTPVLLETARRRSVDVIPFLYGCVFMANASSLFLPGSNLTNLLVLAHQPLSGASFFARMLPSALAATLLTAAGLALIHRRRLGVRGERARERPLPLRVGAGLWGVLAAAALMLALRNAALPVLALGLALLAWRAHHRELAWWQSISQLGLPMLLGLFALAVALGALARASALPAQLLHSASAPLTAAVAAIASVLFNNLPAAAVLSATPHFDTRALLLGLNIGPNLAVSGSLAVLLWWRAARAAGERPSALAYTRQGVLLAPLALLGALAVGAA